MSTLQATNLKHASSASNNIVLDSSGNASVANDLKFNSGYGSSATAYGCRAWVNFNGTGTVAIRASGNVTSITDNGTGDYTVNFTTAMPDANYSVIGTASSSSAMPSSSFGGSFVAPHQAAPTTTAIRVGTAVTSTAGGYDSSSVFVAIFR